MFIEGSKYSTVPCILFRICFRKSTNNAMFVAKHAQADYSLYFYSSTAVIPNEYSESMQTMQIHNSYVLNPNMEQISMHFAFQK